MTGEFRAETAFVFPGMGPSNFADVGRFMVINPFARRLVAVADERLGYSLVDRFRETEGDYSEFAQVAFLVNCVALAQWAEHALGVEPDVCTGPSFGEKAATAYTGALPLSEAVWMTARLARCMDEYFSREHRDVVTHSFVRAHADRLGELLAELDDRGEWYDISCYIDDDFFMLSLRERNLEWLERRLRGMGAMSLYTMRPPMHSSAFGPLRRKAEDEVFGRLEFSDPRLPVIADQDGSVVTTAEGMRTMLLDGFVRPLRWPDVVASMKRLGVTKVCVSGPDSLFGRVGCTRRNFEVVAVNPRLALRPRPRVGAGAGAA
ncbi:[acyl-carrier-protein] S-malonyltransferase [Streptosporangium album]|uniref:[acyl-carrier-protein] S-malonyltransferase n=1 Tax=Streptosporangium album TaxID=47479 RepID=A0A7W7S534_9ACTN|nr:acyltransferase domain-containing protein [Streptosporangium album]MBB4944044.1 [acyl-carrier-protein] S-malonyltransferase [Streptosporangium album]